MKDHRIELVEHAKKRLRYLKHLRSRMRKGILTPAQQREYERMNPEYDSLQFYSYEYPKVIGLEPFPPLPEPPPPPPSYSWAGIRLKLFEVYDQRCNCCGETNPAFLTLDHVLEDGQEHWYECRGSRAKMMHDAIEHPDKNRFQILCYNCNVGKYKNFGQCPHKGRRTRWPKKIRELREIPPSPIPLRNGHLRQPAI